MLRAARQREQAVVTKRAWNLVVFSVGGVKLAARTEDIGGVSPWGETIPVPSRTPYVSGLMKQGRDVMPIYDLAARLHCDMEKDAMLCLVARHADGPIAIRIDAEIPSLHSVDIGQIRPSDRTDIETLGCFRPSEEDIDIVAVQRLVAHRKDSAGR